VFAPVSSVISTTSSSTQGSMNINGGSMSILGDDIVNSDS